LPDNREAWRARERGVPISAELNFTCDGLVLGAGTVIVPAQGPRLLKSPDGEEARVLALLSAAYGKAVPPSVLGNIRRAAKTWCEGDDCLAYIHLVHAGLQPLHDSEESAYRLFLADSAMKAGASPHAVCGALRLNPLSIDTVKRFYNEDEPRVPKGSGRPSGEWTRDGGVPSSSLLSYLARGAASWLRVLTRAAVASLGEYALTLLVGTTGGAAAFGLLFIPSPNKISLEGEVEGIPGLRYSWNRDEALLRLTYDDPDGGQRTFFARLDGVVLRDSQDRIIGRVLSSSNIAIDLAAVSPDLVDDDEPRFCPDPGKDRRTNDKGLAYENYIKSIVNPENPTPPYIGYKLSNAVRPVSFDDCQHSTGTMIEIKDGYAAFLETDWGQALVTLSFLKQAEDQVQAAGTRPVRWYFSQKEVADFARKIFGDAGLGNIQIIFEPWPGGKK
jgi:hypothetical protein